MTNKMKNDAKYMGVQYGFVIELHCECSPAEYWMAKKGSTVFTRKNWSDLKRHLQAYTGKSY
jgi:hypothetical protein